MSRALAALGLAVAVCATGWSLRQVGAAYAHAGREIWLTAEQAHAAAVQRRDWPQALAAARRMARLSPRRMRGHAYDCPCPWGGRFPWCVCDEHLGRHASCEAVGCRK